METARVQQLGNDVVLETTNVETVKKKVTEKRLLNQKAYFKGMVAKGEAGLASVEAQLTTIKNARTK
jgi:hypothetical protein